jgi:hypothetical protein
MAKKRAFVRYSKQGKIVPGSLILTAGSFPQGSSTWNEVPADLCCDNPIEITWDDEDVSLTDISIHLKCNGSIVKSAYSSATSSNAATLESTLNNTFGLIGTFSVVGTVVTLIMTATQKNEFCPNGTLSFEIFED